MPPAVPKRTPLLEGTFSDHSLDEVLDVLSMSRQLMQLAIHRADNTIAALVVKAGHVLGAVDHRAGVSGPQAFEAIVADPGERFDVVRLKAPPALPAAIGTLAEMLEAARATHPDAAADPRPDVMLEGTFKEFSLPEVLDVLAISRQTTEIVFRGHDSTRGAMVVKAGQVLSAQVLRSGASGVAAFHELVSDPGERFVVLRRTNLRSGDPIGSLAELFERARTQGPPTRSDARPPATPSTPVRKVVRPPPLPSRPSPPPIAKPPPLARTPKPPPVAKAPVATPPSITPPVVAPPELAPPVVAPPPIAEPPELAAEESATRHELGEPVLEGELSSFTIEEVLDVMALSRQAMALHTFVGEDRLAEVVIKAGEVLRVLHGDHEPGMPSLSKLLGDPGERFRVLRLPHRPPAPSLGRMVDLVAKAQVPPTDDWPTAHRVSQSGTPTIQGDPGMLPKRKAGQVQAEVNDREETQPKVRRTVEPETPPVPREEPTGGGPITRDIVHGPLAQGPATGRHRDTSRSKPGTGLGRITLNPAPPHTIVTHGAPPPANPPRRPGVPTEEERDPGSRPLYADAAVSAASRSSVLPVDDDAAKAVRELSDQIGELARAIQALAEREPPAPPKVEAPAPTEARPSLMPLYLLNLATLVAVGYLLLKSLQLI